MHIKLAEQSAIPTIQDWWVKGLLPKGRLVLLAAQGGTGKTSVALYLAKTLAQRGTRVLYWSFEEDEQDFTNKIGKVAGLDIIDNTETDIDLSKEEETIELNNFLFENGYDVLVIDPISALLDGDTNDNQKVRRMLNSLISITKNLGVTVLGIHHFRKPGRTGVENIRGAIIGASAWVDTARLVHCLVKDKIGGGLYIETVKSNISRTGTSWEVAHHIDEDRGIIVEDIVPIEDGMGQKVLDSPEKEVVTPVIAALKELFPIGEMFNLDDVASAGSVASFYRWLSKHPDEYQVCEKKKDGKKAYIFI